MENVKYIDAGLIDYRECWALQQRYFDALLAGKNGGPQAEQALILCEHPHVYTLGRSGSAGNMLITDEFMQRIGATFERIDRGGDITYHGPGQLVGYPILDLERFGLGLKEYIHKLEQTVIETISHYGIRGERSQGATGVWLAAEAGRPLRKISAIGVRSSKWVTMHGFSLNVAPQMEYFSYINPCGFTDRGVTSIAAEIGREVSVDEVKEIFKNKFRAAFGAQYL